MSTYKKVYYFIHYFTNGNIVSGVQFIQADTLSEIRKKWLNYNSHDTSPIMEGIVPKRPKPKLSPEEKTVSRFFNDLATMNARCTLSEDDMGEFMKEFNKVVRERKQEIIKETQKGKGKKKP